MRDSAFRRARASRLVLGAALAVGLAATAWAGGVPRTEAPPDARVYFITPQDGDTVKSPFVVRFGLSGMGVAPAGVQAPNTGHHHLLIDVPNPVFDMPVPADDKHRHFGGGQTETEIELPPGEHTLQLVMGDRFHVPHDPPVVSKRITITVE